MTSSNTSNETIYCNIVEFHRGFIEVHGYLSMFVCIFGSLANVLNICILTRKEMRWPTNFILTGLAFADLLVMLDYIPYCINQYLSPYRQNANHYSYPWAIYTFIHAIFAQVCHFISCCLTVILAIWRYIAVTRPQNNKVWCSAERTKWAIILTYVICPIMCFPIYLTLEIKARDKPVYQNGTLIPWVLQSDTNFSLPSDYYNQTVYYVDYIDVRFYKQLGLWVYGVVLKLLPCVLLTLLSHQLIQALIKAKKRRYNLLSNKGVPMDKLNGKGNVSNQRFLEKEQQTDRTTRMLLAVLLLFLITEFPQGILGLLSVIIGKSFENQCYIPLGDVMDIFALTNSAINFILYCSMSNQFRTAFRKLFKPIILKLLPTKIHHNTVLEETKSTNV